MTNINEQINDDVFELTDVVVVGNTKNNAENNLSNAYDSPPPSFDEKDISTQSVLNDAINEFTPQASDEEENTGPLDLTTLNDLFDSYDLDDDDKDNDASPDSSQDSLLDENLDFMNNSEEESTSNNDQDLDALLNDDIIDVAKDSDFDELSQFLDDVDEDTTNNLDDNPDEIFDSMFDEDSANDDAFMQTEEEIATVEMPESDITNEEDDIKSLDELDSDLDEILAFSKLEENEEDLNFASDTEEFENLLHNEDNKSIMQAETENTASVQNEDLEDLDFLEDKEMELANAPSDLEDNLENELSDDLELELTNELPDDLDDNLSDVLDDNLLDVLDDNLLDEAPTSSDDSLTNEMPFELDSDLETNFAENIETLDDISEDLSEDLDEFPDELPCANDQVISEIEETSSDEISSLEIEKNAHQEVINVDLSEQTDLTQDANTRFGELEGNLAKLVSWVERIESKLSPEQQTEIKVQGLDDNSERSDELSKIAYDVKNIDARMVKLEDILATQKILNDQLSSLVDIKKKILTEEKDAEINELRTQLNKADKRIELLEQNIEKEVAKATAKVLRDEIIPLLAEME